MNGAPRILEVRVKPGARDSRLEQAADGRSGAADRIKRVQVRTSA